MKFSGTPTQDYFNGSKKVVNISLNNLASFNEIIKAIPDAKGITEVTAIAIERLCQHGENYAKMIVPVRSGELRDSITHDVTVNGKKIHGTITAGTDHAMFVEFGVGVVGQGTYPGDDSGWEYNLPTEFKDETGGWMFGSTYTHGNEANPFMYNTALELENNAKRIIQG